LRSEDLSAEELHTAIGALHRGDAPEDVESRLPPDLRPLLAAAARLLNARRQAGDAPRPAFVLGLEEQLRTDLRLRPAVRRGLPLRTRLLALGGVLAGGLLFVGVHQARPGDALYDFKRGIQAIALQTGGACCAAYLDLGWRRYEETKELVEAGNPDGDVLQGVLDDLTAAYTTALRLARNADDPRSSARVETEARLVEAELAQLEPSARPAIAARLRRSRGLIRASLVPAGPIVKVPPPGVPTRPVSPTEVPLPPTATVIPDRATVTPPPTAVRATPVPSPSATTTALPMPTRGPERIDPDPTKTPTALPPPPTPTTERPLTPTRDTHDFPITPVPTIMPTDTPEVMVEPSPSSPPTGGSSATPTKEETRPAAPTATSTPDSGKGKAATAVPSALP